MSQITFKSALLRASEILGKAYRKEPLAKGEPTFEQKEAIEMITSVAFAPIDLSGVDDAIKQLNKKEK